MAKRLTKTKRQPKRFSRRANTGFAAAPTSNFTHFRDYIRLEVDKKDVSNKVKAYIKKHYSKNVVKVMMEAPEWAFNNAGAAASIYWKELGNEFPDGWSYDKSIAIAMNDITLWANKKIEDKKENKIINTRTPADILKEKTSDFIAEVEYVLDHFNSKIWVDWENYSVYNELKKIDAAYNTAKGVYDYYMPLRDEIKELVEKKTPDLVEAYSHMKVSSRKAYLTLIQNILDDCDRYMASKKAVRKTRKPKVKSADKQVEKLNYLKESSEFKVTSIQPDQIIGMHRLYLFNTKRKMLTELICETNRGFEVSGSTIKGFDAENSRSITLRKPLDFLPIVLAKTVKQIDKEWDQLTTKNQTANGRVNSDTIILRTLDK